MNDTKKQRLLGFQLMLMILSFFTLGFLPITDRDRLIVSILGIILTAILFVDLAIELGETILNAKN